LVLLGLWLGQGARAPEDREPVRQAQRLAWVGTLCDGCQAGMRATRSLEDSTAAPLTCLDSACNPLEDNEESPDAWPLSPASGSATAPCACDWSAWPAPGGWPALAHAPVTYLALCRLRC
jgi:hypothetical protein